MVLALNFVYLGNVLAKMKDLLMFDTTKGWLVMELMHDFRRKQSASKVSLLALGL